MTTRDVFALLNNLRHALSSALALIWLGIGLGVAFIATPAHFMSPHIDLAQALDVNRYTFMLQNRVEIALAVALLALLAWRRASVVAWVLFAVVAAIVAAQGLWLVPVLAARGEMIMAGQTPPPSSLHAIAVGAEAAKLLALAAIAFAASRRNPSAASR
ncbi:MAG: hypothetical protein RIM84_10975 [Alphaproteobacteria bacterium]